LKTVGVFDSGVGGLSVLRALLAELPDTRFVYVADSANAPYGEREAAHVRGRTAGITAWLREAHAINALVVACNTATACAIDALREQHPGLPIVGVEPALKPAAAFTRSGHIGVLATRGTLQSERFARLHAQVAASRTGKPLHFTCLPCDGLADAIERHDAPATRALCERYLGALRDAAGDAAPMDTLVLGCTHYPFAADILAGLCGPDVTLVDTGAPVARRTRQVLGRQDTQGPPAPPPVLLSTGDAAELAQAARRWLGLHTAARRLAV